MTMKRPSISVLMGVYYRRESTVMLERSIRSILAQTLPDFEFLICDDGSSREACSCLDQIAAGDERIRPIRRGNLMSLPSKLNACLGEAQGQWIARMDDDDYSHPQRFEKQLTYLRNNPQVDFVGCNVNLSRNGSIAGVRYLPEHPTVRDFYFTQPYIHPTLVFKRAVLSAVGGYSESPQCLLCEDYDLLLRLYEHGYRGSNLQEILFDYTVPSTAKGNRKITHRWNEAVTRYHRFKSLHVLPGALPYVLKPLAVGLIPEPVLKKLKSYRT